MHVILAWTLILAYYSNKNNISKLLVRSTTMVPERKWINALPYSSTRKKGRVQEHNDQIQFSQKNCRNWRIWPGTRNVRKTRKGQPTLGTSPCMHKHIRSLLAINHGNTWAPATKHGTVINDSAKTLVLDFEVKEREREKRCKNMDKVCLMRESQNGEVSIQVQ